MSTAVIWMNVILVAIALAIGVSIWRFHRSPDYENFNLIYLITARNGFPDRPALMEMIVFVLMSWGFVAMTVEGKISEWYVGLYVGAFVVRAGHAAWLAGKDKNVQDGQK